VSVGELGRGESGIGLEYLDLRAGNDRAAGIVYGTAQRSLRSLGYAKLKSENREQRSR
jgi:hypothetical protein